MTPGPDTSAPPPHARAPIRRAPPSLPALLYVLGAFGVVSGAFGAQSALNTIADLIQPADVYAEKVARAYDGFKGLVPAEALERFSARQAQIQYARRNAALPLAAIGLILSFLLLAGSLRAMRGEAWGLSAWILAAMASIPYQLLSAVLAVMTANEMQEAFKLLPAAPGWAYGVQRELSVLFSGLAIGYFATCLVYLRTGGVRSRFSDGAGTTPSA
jgi:hypothetical protein